LPQRQGIPLHVYVNMCAPPHPRRPLARVSGVLTSGITAGHSRRHCIGISPTCLPDYLRLIRSSRVYLYKLRLDYYFSCEFVKKKLGFSPPLPACYTYHYMDSISLWAAFGAGVASFISPCVLPLVPVYLASLAGPEILELQKIKRLPLFLHTVSFVLGFGLIFTLMGALAGLAGVNINPNSSVVKWISGGLLILFGLFMLAALKIPWLNFEKRLSPSLGQSSSYLRSLLIGGVFTLAWTPCLSPLLGSVLTLAISSDTAWQGAYLLAIYSMGLGLPFLLIGAFFGVLSPLIKKLGRFSRCIYVISGILLVIIGILIVSGNLSWLYG
jgi:cytochrome c-type biogenesis protein